MTTLSDLVALRNRLQEFDVNQLHQKTKKEFLATLDPLHYTACQGTDYLKRLNDAIENVHGATFTFTNVYQNCLSELQQKIDALKSQYLDKSNDVSRDDQSCRGSAVIDRRLTLSTLQRDYFNHRVHVLSSWQTPALIIRPGKEDWINHMVSNDPLYLADTDEDCLTYATENFPQVYQRRLRPYIFDESKDTMLIDRLPLNQFGLIFAWYYFDFRSVGFLEKFLGEVEKLLRPGGTFAFTYNNCDHHHGVRLVERNYATYIDRSQIDLILQNFNFEIVNHWTTELLSWSTPSPMAWVELRKPGTTDSLRGGQSLARIVAESK